MNTDLVVITMPDNQLTRLKKDQGENIMRLPVRMVHRILLLLLTSITPRMLTINRRVHHHILEKKKQNPPHPTPMRVSKWAVFCVLGDLRSKFASRGYHLVLSSTSLFVNRGNSTFTASKGGINT